MVVTTISSLPDGELKGIEIIVEVTKIIEPEKETEKLKLALKDNTGEILGLTSEVKENKKSIQLIRESSPGTQFKFSKMWKTRIWEEKKYLNLGNYFHVSVITQEDLNSLEKNELPDTTTNKESVNLENKNGILEKITKDDPHYAYFQGKMLEYMENIGNQLNRLNETLEKMIKKS